jgi:hypothetical protein
LSLDGALALRQLADAPEADPDLFALVEPEQTGLHVAIAAAPTPRLGWFGDVAADGGDGHG